jgi:hypothetical protein
MKFTEKRVLQNTHFVIVRYLAKFLMFHLIYEKEITSIFQVCPDRLCENAKTMSFRLKWRNLKCNSLNDLGEISTPLNMTKGVFSHRL